jgi:hypothetical protein
MHVLAVADRIESTIAAIRIVEPLRALAAAGTIELHAASLLDVEPRRLAEADVLVLQRPSNPRALALLAAMQRGGGRVIVEIDDLLTEPPPHLADHARALERVPHVRRALEAADLVTVSTPRLGQALATLAPRVHVVPNAAAAEALAAAGSARHTPGAPLHLVLAGSDRVAVPIVARALQSLLHESAGAVKLVGIASAADDLRAAGLPHQALTAMPRAAFVATVAAIDNAVALIPLGETRFDACKSAIKWFDYAALGIPVLCSDVPPYADVIVDGVDGRLLPNDADAWLAALRELRAEPGAAWRLAQQAARTVASRHTPAHTTAAWADALALLGPRRHPAPSLPWWQTAWSDVLRRLQRANRARLARRGARRQTTPHQDKTP